MAKLVMFRFYYECLLPKFGDKLQLCFTDTDSFICRIETNDLHADMAEISHWFDSSNFDKGHPLFSSANKRVLGKFKSETGDILPTEFCGLRSKMYSLVTPDPSKSFLKSKGISKCYIKKNTSDTSNMYMSWTVGVPQSANLCRSNRRDTKSRLGRWLKSA